MFPKARKPKDSTDGIWKPLALIAVAIAVVWILAASFGGCASVDLETRLGTVESDIEVVGKQVGVLAAGRDNIVNEPVTGWIMAAGYALFPVSFLTYLLMHRSKMFRAAKDRIRGNGVG